MNTDCLERNVDWLTNAWRTAKDIDLVANVDAMLMAQIGDVMLDTIKKLQQEQRG